MPNSATIVCKVCTETLRLPALAPASIRDLEDFLEEHRGCQRSSGDRPAFTLRYDVLEDFNQAAYRVVQEATRERSEKAPVPLRKDEKTKGQ